MNLQHVIKINQGIFKIQSINNGVILLDCGAVVHPKRKTVVYRNYSTGRMISRRVRI